MINFYEHDFSNLEIARVVEVLKGSWVNSGPEALTFKEEITQFLSVGKIRPEVILTSSAWASLFLSLKAWGIGKGDEVITTPYTFSATANVILQHGAKVVFADVGNDYLINPEEIAKKITPRTKAIITMDYGGQPADYKKIHSLVKLKREVFRANNPHQEELGRVLILGDGAHSFGSYPIREDYDLLPDIYAYSFHTVKNLTTIDGGAISIINPILAKNIALLENIKSLILHGMSSNAYTRLKQNKFYDIVSAGYKANLTDVQAAIGRMQLKRMPEFLKKKNKILDFYNQNFSLMDSLESKNYSVSKDYKIFPHLYTLEIKDKSFSSFNKKLAFIEAIKEKKVILNVHYIPLPLTQFYKKLGYAITDYPVTKKLAGSHFSIPFYTKLKPFQLRKIVKVLKDYFITY